MELSESQKKVLMQIKWWYQRPERPFFILNGYAGTGKTTMIPFIISELKLDMNDVCFAAYTGKAVNVLHSKGLKTARTIHSHMFKAKELNDGTIHFTFDRYGSFSEASLIIIDEFSMIDEELANYILSYNVPVLLLGDPGQLSPVTSNMGYFIDMKPDVTMTEIHRQAEDNPIIAASILARTGQNIPYGTFGDNNEVTKVPLRDLDSKYLFTTEQILTGKNETRRALNELVKDHYGFQGTLPAKPGIKLICLKNDRDLGIYNGSFIENTTPASKINMERYQFKMSFQTEHGHEHKNKRIYTRPLVNDQSKLTNRERFIRNRLVHVDYGYAITAHKSQGSQWNEILIYDDGFATWRKDERCRWLYTAITRAAYRIVIASDY